MITQQRLHTHLAALFILLFTALATGAYATPPSQEPTDDRPMIVRLRNVSPDIAHRLVEQGIDLLARDDADLLALVTPAEQIALRSGGWNVQIEADQTEALRRAQPAAYMGGYRTVEETEQFLHDIAEQYPHLATLVDFGDSWERQQSGGTAGYDMLALRLTQQSTPGPKPVFFLMAAIHARELSTSEIATRFISELVEGYGVDPDITWILDQHEVVVVPIANPDGRKLAEQGQSQRKNTNTLYCDSDQIGIDLNRNSSYQWGTVVPPTTPPCSLTYPGPTAASEPETQALQNFITSLYPDHTPPSAESPAPDDTTGLLITLHSYSDLVLWPWGYTSKPAPNDPTLEQLGQRLASFNGYQPKQSWQLYPTSGTTDDWSYGTLGIASYTFEIGPAGSSACSMFMPPYACLDGGEGGNFWALNWPALAYAARVARAPYTQPAGPDAHDLQVITDTTTLTLTLTLDGRDQVVTAGEIYLDAPPWQNGTPIVLQPTDGAFDTLQEVVQATLPISPNVITTPAVHPPLILARGQASSGEWGPFSAAWMHVSEAAPRYDIWLPAVMHP